MDAFLFDEAENFLGVEALDHYVTAAEQCEEMRDAPAVGVEKRDGVKLDGGFFDLQSQADVQCVKIDVAVGEHYTFGIGAGAAGVEKFGEGCFVNGRYVRLIRRGCSQESVVIFG